MSSLIAREREAVVHTALVSLHLMFIRLTPVAVCVPEEVAVRRFFQRKWDFDLLATCATFICFEKSFASANISRGFSKKFFPLQAISAMILKIHLYISPMDRIEKLK